MVKIGLTANESTSRAQQLSSHTGVPTAFEVVYDELVSDCVAVERRLHQRFSGHRVNERREFFRVPIRQAIAALQEEARAYPVDPSAEQKVDILPRLEARFRRWLRRDLVRAHIVQVGGVVYLECTLQPNAGSKDMEIRRIDLCDYGNLEEDRDEFPPDDPIEVNSQRFLAMDTYGLWYLLPIFNEEADKYFRGLEKRHESVPFTP